MQKQRRSNAVLPLGRQKIISFICIQIWVLFRLSRIPSLTCISIWPPPIGVVTRLILNSGMLTSLVGTRGNPRCAIDQFYKIAKDLKIGIMPKQPRLCKAEPGMEHAHPPPDRDLVSTSLFRWRCGLEVIHRNMGPSVAVGGRRHYCPIFTLPRKATCWREATERLYR